MGVGLGVIAGCTASPEPPTTRATPNASDGGVPGSATPDSGPATPANGSPLSGAGNTDLPVPKSELRKALPRDAIPAITDPRFGPDWNGIEIELGEGTYRPRLADDDPVIGVERGVLARAYPLSVLSWHEVVNDDFATGREADGTAPTGDPLLVTYCPLCKSAMVAERTVRGEATIFGVSGYLWHENLVMYDERTESLWSQIRATAIHGPEVGTEFTLRPATLTTWGAWRESHINAEVLLPPPLSPTVVGEVRYNYGFNLYEQWERIWERRPEEAPGSTGGDTRLPARAIVIGIRSNGIARAYPRDRVAWTGVVNDVVGELPVVVSIASGRSLVAYDRRIGGSTPTFEPGDGGMMVGGGSRWDLDTGRAVDGPYAGEQLARANELSPMLWFAWLEFNPETEVYKGPD